MTPIRHILIRPTDVQGATFEIEFVRLLSRKEYFVSNSPLVSWEGLKAIYHKTLVAKTAEVIRFPLSLPDWPWLDLALGTTEDGLVTFQVKIRPPAGGSAEDVALLNRTITTPHRWEAVQVDLSDYAKEDVILSLSLAAEKNVSIGYWGSPVIHNSGGINSVFLDGSVAKVPLRALWKLKWHRTFDTAGPWTKAGGVQPEDWPQWMRKFKDD